MASGPAFVMTCRRFSDRLLARVRPWRFELRLGFALVVSLATVMMVGHHVLTSAVTDALLERDREHHAADARSIEAAYGSAVPGVDLMSEVGDVVDTIAHRPGVTAVELVDAGRTVVATSVPGTLGEHLENTHFAAALRDGRGFGGRVTSEEDGAERSSPLEFVEPVTLGHERFALEIDADASALERQLAAVRGAAAGVFGLGLVLTFVLFYLLGGRTLSQRHRNVMRRATQDPLTELGNHRAFQEELQRALSFAARRGEPFAVALVDLDDFKYVNDTQGHRHGDEVLIALAGVLSSGRTEDRAFRIGGDEFALLFPGTDGSGAEEALERMLAAARHGTRPVSFTAGVAALTPSTGDDAAVVWEQADAALYEGKRSGGSAIVVFDDVAELLSVVTPEKVRALRALLDEPSLEVAFQPIWRLRDQSLLGVEALARPWDGYGFDGPADAFAVAEKIGRAHELDSLCRSAALARAGALPDDALLFLNVHPQTLDHDALDGDRLLRAVTEAGLDPARVVLEITERSHARLARVIAGAARLREAGFRVALDDVGCGNSGLETLRQLPVDYVKIDRSIIAGAATDVSAQAVLVAIVAYARRTGALVIAEGIESEAVLTFVRHAHELDAMRDLSIEGGQGYLLGRPTTELRHAHATAA
jgi:diguanylate cyclase (GGDEF)-like protein